MLLNNIKISGGFLLILINYICQWILFSIYSIIQIDNAISFIISSSHRNFIKLIWIIHHHRAIHTFEDSELRNRILVITHICQIILVILNHWFISKHFIAFIIIVEILIFYIFNYINIVLFLVFILVIKGTVKFILVNFFLILLNFFFLLLFLISFFFLFWSSFFFFTEI